MSDRAPPVFDRAQTGATVLPRLSGLHATGPTRGGPPAEHPLAPDQNHLLELLPAADLERLLGRCESVQLHLGDVLCEAGVPLPFAYFPVDGFISLLTRIEDHPSLEVGMVGREGLFGAALVLGVAVSPLQALVQGAGQAWRLPAAALVRELARSAALRQTLHRYVYVVMAQMASSAACLRFHLIGPRLARWLLMSADRAHASQFQVTHEFLACMLGVRRVGVTVAAGELQRLGLIAYHRGRVTVLDRAGLEQAACPCYARQHLAYQALLA
ncbi:Crp/Fnr family transcriptional regulator [Rubrivivax pictus]|uniref:Crp/Fnr family transcriptional regulator n=1 Tax=Pseudaquabacterium pictum TaxID=2315236 RepID=A0A480AK06_9BURK|nr:Crp/Fnr family transcriptional regulator [Rubrivivax pictus]